MKVVFLENFDGGILAGDVKVVKDGFARNFLVTKNIALPATEKIIKETESLREKGKVVREKIKQENIGVKDALSGKSISFIRPSDGNSLYSTLSLKEISEEIEKVFSQKIPAKCIKNSHIKLVGDHKVEISLGEAYFTINVKVSKEGGKKETKKKEEKTKEEEGASEDLKNLEEHLKGNS